MFRETAITVAGVRRVIRTEGRTAKRLEVEHTKAVKAALIEMRTAATVGSDTGAEFREYAERDAARRTRFPKCNWDAATRKLRPVPTVDPRTYMEEVEPGHWVQP